MSNDANINFFKLASTAAMAIAAFALIWVFNANAQIAEMKILMELKFQALENLHINNDQLSKHWKLHGWARDQIQGLRHEHDLAIESWPDLD